MRLRLPFALAGPFKWPVAFAHHEWQNTIMSLESLKQEIAVLPLEGRKQLMSYLIDLRTRETDPDWAQRTAEVLDDKTSSRWIPWEEAQTRLNALDDQEEAP